MLATATFLSGALLAAGQVAAPVFDPGEGDSAVTFPVTISSATPGAVIRYTLNGSTPGPLDPSVASGGTVTVARSLTLKAKAWSGSEQSTTTVAEYRLTGDVAAGSHHVLALSSAGRIHAWGEQGSGRLANGLTATANVATPGPANYAAGVPIADAIAVSAGNDHSLLLKSDRTVWSFGNNDTAELGDTTSADRAYPVRVCTNSAGTAFLADCVDVSAGSGFSGALGANQKVYMWGSRVGGRLGNGGLFNAQGYAATVKRGDVGGNPELGGIVSLRVGGGFVLAREACALESPGTLGQVWSWGHNNVGQLGQGGTTNQSYAYRVKLNASTFLTDAWNISSGSAHGVVVRRKEGDSNLQGSVWSFGEGDSGRLGRNSTANSSYAVQVVKDTAGTPLSGIKMVAAGSAHTLALDNDGKVWAWGYNVYGAVGDGTIINRLHAVPVVNPVTLTNPDGSGQLGDEEEGEIVWVAAGGEGANNTSYAISASGKIYGWGRNDDGELGTGSTSTGATSRPLQVPGMQVVPGYPEVALAHTVTQSLDPGSVTLTATPTDPDGAGDIDKVEFYSQGVFAGQATTSPWQAVLSDLPEGNYHVYAVVTDAGGHQGQSSPLSFTISPADPNGDPDGDGLTNATEDSLGTARQDPDTDDDGMGDGYEHYYGLAPLSAANGQGGLTGPADDKDGDGMQNKDESDRGRIPISDGEVPNITGTGPGRHAAWFGVEGVTYHFEFSTDQITWTRHPVPFSGENAEWSLSLVSVVSPVPDPFHARLVTESGAPEVSLAATVTAATAPGAATLTATPVDSDGAGDIASVEFFLNDASIGIKTAPPPWTLEVTDLASGTHTVAAIVTDQGGKRGFSGNAAVTVIPPESGADSDSDGLPDDWELGYFGSLTRNATGDEDGDLVSNLDEYLYWLDPTLPDTDADGLTDHEELVVHGTLPWDPDTDQDGLGDYEEVVVHSSNPFDRDTDDDGMLDGWEGLYDLDPTDPSDAGLDPDDDDIPNGVEHLLRLDPTSTHTGGSSVSDGERDADKDGLANAAELTVHFTAPDDWDSDDDGMPDGWEIAHNLDAKKDSGDDGDHGADGDSDGDGLSNFDEWLNGTNPRNPNTDGNASDTVNDGDEVSQGSNPLDGSDGGAAPPEHEMVMVPFTIGDPSGSSSEQWKLSVKGLGPDDTRPLGLASQTFGEVRPGSLKLRKWNRYEITVEHQGSDPEHLKNNDGKPDFDWEATVGGLPATQSSEQTAEAAGVNNFFVAAKYWLVDNRQAVFTTEKHGDDDNIVAGKKAFLVPTEIGDNVVSTGVDDVSVTADTSSPGYQPEFWIMAPIGGATFNNEMYYKIPLNPSAPLKFTCPNATSSPASVNVDDTLYKAKMPSVAWSGSGAESSDNTPEFKIGDSDDVVDLPIRVKSMKRRTIKVVVFPVTHLHADRHDIPMPTEELIEGELNKIFGHQINAWVEVEVKGVDSFDYAFPTEVAEGVFESLAINRSEKETNMIKSPKFSDGDADIVVFVLDNVDYYSDGDFATGASYLQLGTLLDNRCIVNRRGDKYLPDRTDNALIHTIAHEMGHIMVGNGHPDDPDLANRGAAALNGTTLNGHPQNRLMCSGSTSTPLVSTLLVKAEWDRAEAWLTGRPKGDD